MIRVIHNGIRLYLDPDDILYVYRSGKGDAVARTKDGAVPLLYKTSLILLAKKYQQFVLIHRNTLVRRDYIKAVVRMAKQEQGCTVTLRNDQQLHGSYGFYQEWTA